MNVLICDPISPKGIALFQSRPEFKVTVLEKPLKEAELISVVKDVEAMVVRSETKVTRKVIEAAPKLRVVEASACRNRARRLASRLRGAVAQAVEIAAHQLRLPPARHVAGEGQAALLAIDRQDRADHAVLAVHPRPGQNVDAVLLRDLRDLRAHLEQQGLGLRVAGRTHLS